MSVLRLALLAALVVVAGCGGSGGSGGGETSSIDMLPSMVVGQVFRYSAEYGWKEPSYLEYRVTAETGTDLLGESYRVIESVMQDSASLSQTKLLLSQDESGAIYYHGEGYDQYHLSFVDPPECKALWAPSPLTVGGSGDYHYVEGNLAVSASWNVLRLRTITVPAGTFRCYEVLLNVRFDGVLSGMKHYYYYSPLLPFYVMQVNKSDSGTTTSIYRLESVTQQ